jgi:uncharacterized protein YndB with AHSA1/START domain
MESKLATEKIGDAAVAAKTGRTWAQWFRVLDRGGARKMTHREIVALVRQHGAGDWWGQMITVGYEQERGMRQKHQRPDGFQISASRTMAVPKGRLYDAWVDPVVRARWMPRASFTIRTATAGRSLRLTWDAKDSRVEVMFYAKGAGKSQVTVQHGRLPTAAAGERMKSWWKGRLGTLKELLEGRA